MNFDIGRLYNFDGQLECGVRSVEAWWFRQAVAKSHRLSARGSQLDRYRISKNRTCGIRKLVTRLGRLKPSGRRIRCGIQNVIELQDFDFSRSPRETASGEASLYSALRLGALGLPIFLAFFETVSALLRGKGDLNRQSCTPCKPSHFASAACWR